MISIICPSKKGEEIAFKLQKSLNAKLYLREDNFKLKDVTKEAMQASSGIIFISSTGIAVRAIAEFIKSKDKDPGVVSVDLSSKYAINILSGHLGGGNELTLKVAEILNAMPIITTASDNLNLVAPDIIAKNNDLVIDDLKIAKNLAALLIDDKTINVKDDYNIINITNGYKKTDKITDNCIWITHDLKNDSKCTNVLKLIKKDVVLGVGCRRNTSFEKLDVFIRDTLEKYNIDIRAVKKIASVDIKKDEVGLISFAKSINCPFETFNRELIKTVQDKYEKSEFVLKTLGVTNVCETCVDLADAEVIVNKIKHDGMTLSIGTLKEEVK